MKNWEDYKKHVKDVDPEAGKEIEEIEEVAEIITAIIEKRKELGISQRELAVLCGIPQSSIARIENGKTAPNLRTLIHVMKPLGLKLYASTSSDNKSIKSGG